MGRADKIFAGSRLRAVRERHDLSQGAFAARLGVSVSYLSQMETDVRPITVAVLLALGREFAVDLSEFAQDEASRLAADLREALADPLFAGHMPGVQEIKRTVSQAPNLARSFAVLHQAYRQLNERLQTMDEAITANRPDGHLLPWEEVRDYFHYRDNYVGELDEAAESLAQTLDNPGGVLGPQLERLLRERHGIAVRLQAAAPDDPTMRRFDPARREVVIDANLSPDSRAFLIAHQLALVEFAPIIEAIAAEAPLRTEDARQILRVGLANYAAGALLMPYGRFIEAARLLRHDVEQLQQQFGTSFEQVCHRLSNLQRPGARGVPFFFVRVDMAGNITKRHSATRLQFARYGGTCPLWVAHEAVALPGEIKVQLIEMPDGVRYVCMARGIIKRSGSFLKPARRYAVALGCEAAYASQFVYADKLEGSTAVTPIGASCRICPRTNCAQRAFPPADRRTLIDLHNRNVVPYRFE
ncbi:helix-turn-helix domain-containing protein [Pedomonas mirosovicensis]|uniref:helix-turn-helix domain-containing protein n=1 Tax=Pedomonas mirosovicensis TaxID=2908641 RepID=UPI0021673ED2|nr:short-chain fatty acyl-CoA regulator family protein [Pedomonas mirosovicensis]MCH8686258.1 short-chain fatty acyl-CoA regulator family protein [Pedomonas mirosovicensis]